MQYLYVYTGCPLLPNFFKIFWRFRI